MLQLKKKVRIFLKDYQTTICKKNPLSSYAIYELHLRHKNRKGLKMKE